MRLLDHTAIRGSWVAALLFLLISSRTEATINVYLKGRLGNLDQSVVQFMNKDKGFSPGDHVFSLPTSDNNADSSFSNPNLADSSGITLRCVSNALTPWKLVVTCSGLTNKSLPGVRIKPDSISISPVSAGIWVVTASAWVVLLNNIQSPYTLLSLLPVILYKSGNSDPYNLPELTDHKNQTLNYESGTEIQVFVNIKMPANAAAGDYEGDIVFSIMPQ